MTKLGNGLAVVASATEKPMSILILDAISSLYTQTVGAKDAAHGKPIMLIQMVEIPYPIVKSFVGIVTVKPFNKV